MHHLKLNERVIFESYPLPINDCIPIDFRTNIISLKHWAKSKVTDNLECFRAKLFYTIIGKEHHLYKVTDLFSCDEVLLGRNMTNSLVVNLSNRTNHSFLRTHIQLHSCVVYEAHIPMQIVSYWGYSLSRRV